MACKALLISLQDLVVNCNVSESVESNQVDVQTEVMQLKYIKPILGKDLFNELLDEISDDTLTVVNSSLVEQIKPALSWLVFSQLIPYANVFSTASGLIKNQGEEFILADKEELGGMAKIAYGNFQVYEQDLKEFLQENKEDYPLWKDQLCRDHTIQGYSISAIGGNHNKRTGIRVHYPARYGK